MSKGNPVILIVDDDPAVLSSLDRGLSRSGYDVRLAESGPGCLQIVRDERPDLVLLDVMLPGGLDGYEVCDRMQARDDMGSVPVIFMTGLDSEEDEARAFASGGTSFLRKPFEIERLIGEVEKHLDIGEQWEALETTPAPSPTATAPERFGHFKEYLLKERPAASHNEGAVHDLRGNDVYGLTRLLNMPEEEVARHISRFLRVPFVQRVHSDEVAIGLLPKAFCEKNLVVPVKGEGDEVRIVVSNPFNWDLYESLRNSFWRGEGPSFSITAPDSIRRLFEDRSDRLMSFAVSDATSESEGAGPDSDGHSVHELAGDLLRAAVLERASDLHFEPKDRHMLVRFRIDGDMQDVRTLPQEDAVRLVSRLKALAGMDIAERRRPQDGSIEVSIDDRRFKLRLATSSTSDGETLVIRLLEPTASSKPLRELGMTDGQVEQVTTMANRHQGMILVVGPTGSGKSTTIFSVLSQVDGQTRSIMSVEDPVEYRIPFANQQQVNERAGVTFESLLKSAMRQDPDILFLGEVRDPFSAKASLDFASSGHLTISSLHAANATTAIFRLERLGIERSGMADSLLGIVAQKLVKRLCPSCKLTGPIEDSEVDMLEGFAAEMPEIVARPKGCPACRETGYVGREAVNEVLMFDSALSEMVRAGASIAEIRGFCVHRGDYMMYHHAIEKVRELSCSPHDAQELVLLEEMRFRQASTARADMGIRAESSGGPAVESEPQLAEPVAAAEPVETKSASRTDPSARPSLLVVEDDPVSQKLVASMLKKADYSVATANDGVEALLELGTGDFDLIVSDINMPNLDGVKLLEMLLTKGVEVPVIFLTGDWSGDIEGDVLKLGAADFIRKPINPDVLLGRVSNVLTRTGRVSAAS